MKQRVITGVLAAIVFIGALLLMNTIVFPIFIAVLCVLAVYEVEHAVGLKNKMIYIVSLLFSAVVPFIFHFRITMPVAAFGGAYVIFIFIMMLLEFETTKFEQALTAIFASTAIPYSFSLMIFFRDINDTFPQYSDIDGIYFILFAYFTAWMTDIFAYFVGSKFGKHKLCPKISPKKSVEGAIGGIVGEIILNTLLLFVFNKFFFKGESEISYVTVIILSLVLSVISMFGDLAASTIKRNFGIKDFGKILPGHGGIMDRFDSVLFVLPALYSAIYIIARITL